MQQKFKALSQKAKSVIVNYPVVLLMSVIMAFTIVYNIETDLKSEDNFLPIRLIITSGLGISLMFAIKMLCQRIGKTVILHALGIGVLVGFFFILPVTEAEFTAMYAFVIVPTAVLSHLLVAFIAFVDKDPESRFWQFNKNLFINFFLTAVFTGILTGGVELAIVSVDQLFTMDFDGDIYAQTFVLMSIVGSVFIFLLFNEKGLHHLEIDGEYPVVLKFFTQFILIPLLSIYVIILYFYAAKILVNWQLPEGWVSYLVLAYSIVGILALLLVHPLKGSTAKSWVRIFSGIFYFSLLPLIVLLFVAIFTRVLEYGFTEPRYYVLLLAVWLLTVVLYFIFVKQATIKFIPISLFILGLFSLVFPYLNTFSVSKRSQKQELEMLLKSHNLLRDNKINFDAEVPVDVASNISDKFDYLSERFEHEYLGTFLDSIDKSELQTKRFWSLNDLFINKIENAGRKLNRNLRLNSSKPYSAVEGYQFVMQQSALENDGVKLNNDTFDLKIETHRKSPSFILKVNEEHVDLMPSVAKFFKKYEGRSGVVESDSLFIDRTIGKYHVRILFESMNRSEYNNEINFYFSNMLLLVKEQ